MKDGLLPVVAAAGGVAVVLVWSMSVNDPYWRLFETPSVPAPAYEQPEDLIAVLATVTREFSNNDAGATSPAADPLAGAGRSDIRPDIPLDITLSAAEAAAIPEPMVALVPPLEPEPMTGPATDAMIAYRPPVAALPVPMIALAPPLEPEPMTGPAIDSTIAYQLPGPAIPVPAGLETEAEIVIAFAPQPLPAPAALRDRGAGAGSETLSGPALDPFVAPAPPAQPRVAASELTEEALALGPHARIDVQRRLALAGFDPSGFDGAFGPRTRRAIADFQTAWGFPATGYLEEAVYAELNQRTEDAYQALRRQAAAAPSAAP
ncbi:MAG: peptidoglycan-binding protein, partial [Paracoccaceae bacterium]